MIDAASQKSELSKSPRNWDFVMVFDPFSRLDDPRLPNPREENWQAERRAASQRAASQPA